MFEYHKLPQQPNCFNVDPTIVALESVKAALEGRKPLQTATVTQSVSRPCSYSSIWCTSQRTSKAPLTLRSLCKEAVRFLNSLSLCLFLSSLCWLVWRAGRLACWRVNRLFFWWSEREIDTPRMVIQERVSETERERERERNGYSIPSQGPFLHRVLFVLYRSMCFTDKSSYAV